MRYYRIEFYAPGSTTLAGVFTSHPQTQGAIGSLPNLSGLIGSGIAALSGQGIQPDPGALNVMIDAYVYNFDTPQGFPVVIIWGVPRSLISQAQNLTGYTVKVYGGFQAGLPLNNPAQAGLLFQGKVYQSFGNWQGTNMALDLVLNYYGATATQPVNLSFSWPAGTPLSQAIQTTLNTAFPGVNVTIQISANLVQAHDESGVYTSLPAFAQMLKPITQQIIGGSSYYGVSIAQTGAGILVQDGTVQPTAQQIAFQDLIGQPVWIGPREIQFVCPMRSDISVGALVKLPPGIVGGPSNPFGAPGAVTTTAASQPQARDSSTFSGTFFVSLVHHMGDFRQPDGLAWVTVINAFAQSS